MKASYLASRPESLVCPFCETDELQPSGNGSMRCESCGHLSSGAMLETLRRISALPDAPDSHACECGHPEMRLLPGGVFHCPACGSEVLPREASGDPGAEHPGEAYRCGWIDGRFGEARCFTENRSLARWQDAPDRLDYYRGHRAGSQARRGADTGPRVRGVHQRLHG